MILTGRENGSVWATMRHGSRRVTRWGTTWEEATRRLRVDAEARGWPLESIDRMLAVAEVAP